jgi:hypothetical protein
MNSRMTDIIKKDYLEWLEIAKRGPLAPWLRNEETYLKSRQYQQLIKKLEAAE